MALFGLCWRFLRCVTFSWFAWTSASPVLALVEFAKADREMGAGLETCWGPLSREERFF